MLQTTSCPPVTTSLPAAPVSQGHSDEDLMRFVQVRNGTALELLYRRHSSILRAVIFRAVHQDADADDVLQEVFIEIWNRADSFTPERGRALGWMITLARRLAIDRIRRNQAYKRSSDRAELELATTVETRPRNRAEEELNSAETREVIAQILNRLPDNQRQAVDLTFFRGLSQRQIAAETGIPVGTIKTRLQLALAKIERALKGVSREFVEHYTASAAA